MASIQNIPLKTIDGNDASLGDYAGKLALVVNVASKCGLTPQYAGLQSLYERFADRGFVVLGFPANDFAGQEPGSDAEIREFCETGYNVSFPMFSKIAVTGAAQHPLYGALTEAQPEAVQKPGSDFRGMLKGHGIEPNPAPGILWNFEKFLVAGDGEVIARFAPDIAPDDPLIVSRIEEELAAR